MYLLRIHRDDNFTYSMFPSRFRPCQWKCFHKHICLLPTYTHALIPSIADWRNVVNSIRDHTFSGGPVRALPMFLGKMAFQVPLGIESVTIAAVVTANWTLPGVSCGKVLPLPCLAPLSPGLHQGSGKALQLIFDAVLG